MLSQVCFICLWFYHSYCRCVYDWLCFCFHSREQHSLDCASGYIAAFPLFYSRPQHHHSCCGLRNHGSGEKPRREVWGFSHGCSNSGPGQGIRETGSIFNKHAIFPNLPRVLTRPWFSEISGGERGWVRDFGEVGCTRQKESQDCAVSPV